MIYKTHFFCLIILFFLITEASSQKFDAEIIKYSTFFEVQKNKLIQTDSVSIQINNRVGDQYTEISIPYSKDDKILRIDAWIETKDGKKVRDLKKSDIVDKSAISDFSLYEDHFNKCFQLKYNIYPYKVSYTYKKSYQYFITLAWWTPVIFEALPTRVAKLQIIIPKKIQVNSFLNRISDSRIDSIGNNLILEWNSSYNKPIRQEIFSQPENDYPYVIIAPVNFNYGVEGLAKDWVSYGNWQYRLLQGLDSLPENEKNTISTLINCTKDKREIVKILYHYLQDHTRYINVSIGIGGFKPYPASYVAQNKYGDCKALTNYLKAMLSFVGIESFYTNVYASEQPQNLIYNFSGPQFNHVILTVPIDHDTIWLECTSNINPFGYVGTFTQNRNALLVSQNNSMLVRIPALKKEDNLVSYKIEFDLTINGNAKVKLNCSFKGRDFEMFNQLHSEFNDGEKDRIIREYMPFDNYEVIDWNLQKLHRDTARIELIATLNLYNYLKPLANEYYLNLSPSRIPPFTIPANRNLSVVLPYPIYNSDTIIYNLPIGYKLKTKPDSIKINSPFGRFELTLNVINGNVIVTKSFELFSGIYSLEQYPKFYNFIRDVKDIDKKILVIKPIN